MIELLVVIAIVAILSAILFPVFAQAREKARSVTCLSNVRQLGTGLSLYVQDHDETFPLGQYFTNGANPVNDERITWAEAIYPYTKQGDRFASGRVWDHGGVFNCPSSPADFQNGHYGYHQDLMGDGDTCPWMRDGGGNPFMYDVATLAEIESPTEKVALLEKGLNPGYASFSQFTPMEWDWVDWINYNRTSGTHDPALDGMNVALAKGDCDFIADPNMAGDFSTYGQCSTLPRFRHNATMTVMFLDGHAKAMPRNSLKWYRNIYMPVGASKAHTRAGWYPY